MFFFCIFTSVSCSSFVWEALRTRTPRAPTLPYQQEIVLTRPPAGAPAVATTREEKHQLLMAAVPRIFGFVSGSTRTEPVLLPGKNWAPKDFITVASLLVIQGFCNFCWGCFKWLQTPCFGRKATTQDAIVALWKFSLWGFPVALKYLKWHPGGDEPPASWVGGDRSKVSGLEVTTFVRYILP